MTDRAEIERMLNMTGRTLEVIPKRHSVDEWDKWVRTPGISLEQLCHQSDVIELLVGALRDALDKPPKWISVENELPKKPGTYLCNYEFEESGRIVMSCDYLGDKGWSFMTAHVTHWAPMLEDPKASDDHAGESEV